MDGDDAQQPQSTGVPEADALLGLKAPEPRTDQPTGVIEADRLLKAGGFLDADTDRLQKHYEQSDKLESRRKELADRGMSFSQNLRSSGPFASLVTLPESVVRPLDYASRAAGRVLGKEQPIGGRVVGNQEYQEATRRFSSQQATDDDLDAIATYERHNQLRAEVQKGANFAQSIILGAGNLGNVVTETTLGGKLIGGAGRLAGFGRAAAPVAAAAGATPAVPAAAGIGSQALALAGATVATPAMYVPMMQQANMKAGRDANDVKGLPTAFGYAYANMAVLGRLGGPVDPAGNAAMGYLKKGVQGVVETNSVDVAAGLADQFLPKAYEIKPEDDRWGSVGAWLRADRAGDAEGKSRVLRDATVQALTFAGFAAMHGREAHAADLTQAYADTIGKLRASGASKTRAGEVIGEMHSKLEAALSAEPYLSREAAREVLGKDLPAELEPYAEKLADTFEPKSKLPTPAEAEAAAPKPAAAAAEPAPGDRVRAPDRPAGDLSTVTAVDPTNPNPARQVEVAHSDGTPASAAPGVHAAPAPGTPVAPPPAEPTAAKAGSSPAAVAAEWNDRFNESQTKLDTAQADMARLKKRSKAGESPTVLRTADRAVAEARASHAEVTRQYQDALARVKSAAIAESSTSRQPLAPAATDSKAPAVAPVESVSPPSNTTAEPAKPLPATSVPTSATPEAGRPNRPKVVPRLAGESPAAYRERIKAANAPPAAVDVRSDVKARYAEQIHSSDLRPDVKADHVARFHALMDKLPPAAVSAIAKSLTKVVPKASGYDVSVAVVSNMMKQARASGDAAWQAEANQLARDVKAGKEKLLGHVAPDGTLTIDGHERHGKDTGKRAVGESVRGEETLAHESGHLAELVAGKLVHSTTPEWHAVHDGEIKGTDPKEPPLSEYATTSPAESFAEFFRLVHESPVSHETIAAEFPEATKFFKDRGLWPEAAHERAGTAEKMPEVFNDRVELPDTSHADSVVKDEPAADAAPREIESSRRERQKASDAEETDKTSDSYVGSKHYERARNAFVDDVLGRSEASKDPAVKDALESVAHNFPSDRLVGAAGWQTAAGGKSLKAYAESVFRADVREVLNDPDFRRAIAASPDAVDAIGNLARRYAAEKAGTHAAYTQDTFDALSIDSRRKAYDDPAQRAAFEANGVKMLDANGELVRTNVLRQGKTGRHVTGLDPYKADVLANDKLSADEQRALHGMLSGKSSRELALALGSSHTTWQNRAKKGLAKMRGVDGWDRFESVEDVVQQGVEYAKAAGESYARGTRERLDRENNVRKASDVEAPDDDQFGTLPFRLRSLAALLSPRVGGRTVWQRLSGAFFGNEPAAVRAAEEQEVTGQIAAYAFDVANASKDLRSALAAEHGGYEKLPADQLEKLDSVLRGAASARAGVGPQTLAALDVMRAQVDKLSLRLIATGAVDTPLAATVTDNLGEYLTRQFQVFRDPKWESKVDEPVVNRFKSWLTNQIMATGRTVTPEEVDSVTKSLLRDGTAAENPIAFLRGSTLGASDVSILRARKDVPDELRALWGEYKDPLVNYSNSVAKMAQLLTSHTFMTRVAREGRGTFLFDRPTTTADGEHVVQITDDDNAAMRPLAGKYTTAEIKRAFTDQGKSPDVSIGMQWYMKALAAAKLAKTVFSHVGQIHNFMSNALIAVRNGHFSLDKAPAAVSAILSDTQAGRDYYRRLTELGLTNESVTYNDLKKTMQDAHGGREYYQGTEGNKILNGVLGRTLKSVGTKAAAMYQYGDTVWKIYGFENEKKQYVASGMPEARAEQKAAEIVRNTYPTYSKIAPGIQALRKAPLAAPFIAFQSEVVRTTVNTMRLAAAELKDPTTRAIGAKRLAGLTAAAALPLALGAATKALFGVDQDEEKALRRFLPEWQKNSQLVYFGRDPKTGHPRYTDLSRIDPHAYLSDGVRAFWAAKDTASGVSDAAKEMTKPFTQEELLVKPAIDVARNKTDQGGEVYNPQADAGTKALKIGQHAGDPFVPAAYGPLRRLGMAVTGATEQKSGKEYDPTAAAVEQGGVRIETPRVREDLASKALGFEKAKRDADRLVQTMIHAKGQVSPDQLKRAQQAAETARTKTMSEFREDVRAAETLGLDRREIAVILRNSGLSVAEVGQLFSQTQVPYQPRLQGSATERERAGQVRKLGVASPPPSQP